MGSTFRLLEGMRNLLLGNLKEETICKIQAYTGG
jgi:hypothetical protein